MLAGVVTRKRTPNAGSPCQRFMPTRCNLFLYYPLPLLAAELLQSENTVESTG